MTLLYWWLFFGAVMAMSHLFERLCDEGGFTLDMVYSTLFVFVVSLFIPVILVWWVVADFFEWLKEEPEDG